MKVGEEKLMSMLKAMIGDYSEVAKSFQEDVLIVGMCYRNSCVTKASSG